MLVMAFNVNNGESLGQYYNLGSYEVPAWVKNKIYAANGTLVGNIESKIIEGVGDNGFPLNPAETLSTYIQKTSDSRLFISNDKTYANNSGYRVNFRIQYDFIIDTD